MFSSLSRPQINQNCVNCAKKIQQDYDLVLSADLYLHKECLQLIHRSLADGLKDQELKQFYNFILSQVVSCSNCKNPLDIQHDNQYKTPLCGKCKQLYPLQQKMGYQVCELCDQKITQHNKLKQQSAVQGIIMCRKCYNAQTGQLQNELQQKPDLREKQKKEDKNKVSQKKLAFNKLFGMGPQQKVQKNQIKNMPTRQGLKKHQYRLCRVCQKKFLKGDQDICYKCDFLKVYEKDNEASLIQGAKIEVLSIPKQNKVELWFQDIQDYLQLFKENAKPKKIQQLQFDSVIQKPTTKQVDVNQKQELQTILDLLERPEQDHKYSLKECKICFNAQSQMMNRKCRHLMMCQPCYKSVLQRQNKKNELCCPVCQTVGKYFKYLQPIYI